MKKAFPNNLPEEPSPVDDFLTRTSITIVTNVQRSKGKISKFMWFTIGVISCIAMTYQSLSVYCEYSKCKIKEGKSYQEQTFAPFVSVTVCDAKPVNWTYLETINHRLVTEVNKYHIDETEKITKAFVLGLMRLSAKEREELYNNTKQFSPKGIFSPNNQEVLQYSFRHPYFGQCVTLNPGLDYTTSAKAMLGQCSQFAMTVRFPIEKSGMVPGLHRRIQGYVFINPRGNPPVFTRGSAIYVYPYDKLSIKVYQELRKIISDRECLSCLEIDDPFRKQSIYYKEGIQEYVYSVEGHIQTLIEKVLLEEFNCVDQYLPLDSLPKGANENITMCTGNEPIRLKGSWKPACDEFSVITSVSRWSKVIDDLILKFTPGEQKSSSSFYEELPEDYDLSTMDATIRIFQPKGYFLVTKMPMYSSGDVFGIIGGNISLWIGISVFSLWEIIELAYMIVAERIVRKFKNDRSKIEHFHNKTTTFNNTNKTSCDENHRTNVQHVFQINKRDIFDANDDK